MSISADIWKALAGVAIFLLGMNFLEEGLKRLAGRSFKLFLKRQTTNNVKAVIGGAIVTAILQSSSIVNLVVLAFVGAGVIRMQNALALILGANLGSTFTSWIIATVGFSFKLEDFALPIAAVSGITMMLVNKESRWHHGSKLLLGLGFLFIGLGYIQTGVGNSLQQLNVEMLNEQPSIVFLIAGFFITALVQSSSATVAIALSALNVNAISLFSAMAIVLGAEAGTAIKLIIASVKGIAAKKRVALGNLLFNVSIAILLFIFLQPVSRFVTEIVGIKDNLIALVFFQSLTNLIGIVLFFPFLKVFGQFLEKRFTNEDSDSLFADKAHTAGNEMALEALEKEAGNFIYDVLSFAAGAFETTYQVPPGIERKKFEKKTMQEKYSYIKVLHGDIQRFSILLQNNSFGKQEAARTAQLISCTRNGMYAAKNIQDALHDIEHLRNSSNDTKYNYYLKHREKIMAFCNHVSALMQEQSSGGHLEKITSLYKEVQQGYTESLQELYKEGMIKHVSQEEISTLVNFNREMYTAFKSLLFSLKDYMLSIEEANQFDELPGFIR